MFKALAGLAIVFASLSAHALPASSPDLMNAIYSSSAFQFKLNENKPDRVTLTRVSPTEVSDEIAQQCTGGSRSGSIILTELIKYGGAIPAVQALYWGTTEAANDLRPCGVRH